MKIILNEDVYNLGEEGDVCEVKPGYGRNYLIPQGLAVAYTKGNAAKFERRRDAIEKRKEEKRTAAMGAKERIESLELTIPMPAGDTGKLFGSVTNATVSDALAKEGLHFERKKIDLTEHTIKMIGKYKARVKLYESNVAELVFKVVDEKTGEMVPKGSAKVAEAPAVSEEAEEEAVEAEESAAEAEVEETVSEESAAVEESSSDEEE